MTPFERDILQHRLVNLLWQLSIEHADSVATPTSRQRHLGPELRLRRDESMPTLSQWVEQRATARATASP